MIEQSRTSLWIWDRVPLINSVVRYELSLKGYIDILTFSLSLIHSWVPLKLYSEGTFDLKGAHFGSLNLKAPLKHKSTQSTFPGERHLLKDADKATRNDPPRCLFSPVLTGYVLIRLRHRTSQWLGQTFTEEWGPTSMWSETQVQSLNKTPFHLRATYTRGQKAKWNKSVPTSVVKPAWFSTHIWELDLTCIALEIRPEPMCDLYSRAVKKNAVGVVIQKSEQRKCGE